MSKIPTVPTPEKLRVMVQNCTTNPLFDEVCKHIIKHDSIEGYKPLGWVTETFGFTDEGLMADPMRVETACRVFSAIEFTLRLDNKRTQIRTSPYFVEVKGWPKDVILEDKDVHSDKPYRERLRKAVDIALLVIRKAEKAETDTQVEKAAINPVLDSLGEWLSGEWGATLRDKDEAMYDAVASVLVMDSEERDRYLDNAAPRRFTARKVKDVVWLLYKDYHIDFFYYNPELKAPFVCAFEEHGVRLPSRQVVMRESAKKPTPKKPGSAAKRKPRVRGEDGKLVKTSTRSLSAREARSKSKRKG